jgi:hypothetical protein
MVLKNLISFSHSATTGTTKSMSFVDSLSLSRVRAVPPHAISYMREFMTPSQFSSVSNSLSLVILYRLVDAISQNTIFDSICQDKLYNYVQVYCIYLYNKQKWGASMTFGHSPFPSQKIVSHRRACYIVESLAEKRKRLYPF